MSLISIKNLSFGYPNGREYIFKNVNLDIDSNYKLGLVGRNGMGKTTLFNILRGKLEYQGQIISNLKFDYFPLEIKEEELKITDLLSSYFSDIPTWKIQKEMNLIKLKDEVLKTKYSSLSKGEQTKLQLCLLFAKDNNFLLLDEVTNHLDLDSRKLVASYLNNKAGFILVSHDQSFLDECIDYVLAINKNSIDLQKGNFSTWLINKENNDNFERNYNKELKSEISRLKSAAKNKENWSKEKESGKYRSGPVDKGYIGHMSAKLMKTSKIISSRMEKLISIKETLLKNVDKVESLKLQYIEYYKKELITFDNVSFNIGNRAILSDISFNLDRGEKLAIIGNNGTGKSTLIKLIQQQYLPTSGVIVIQKNLKISYIDQVYPNVEISLDSYIRSLEIDQTLCSTILRKLDFEKELFGQIVSCMSTGMQRKIQIAISLSTEANLYIWDEPLNYLDIFSRLQLLNLLKDNPLSLILIEHDKSFVSIIATKILNLK
jgi:lincosamide and streptogramin A transport system ATP-binding/permease protein